MSDRDKRRPLPDFPSEEELREAAEALARALDEAAVAMKEFSKAAGRLGYRDDRDETVAPT